MKKHIANILTAARIALSLELLLTEPLTAPFYIVYIISGITDMADGAVARRLGTVSDRGSRLDSIADTVFLAVCLIKLVPVIVIPRWAVVFIIVIAGIRLVNIIIELVKHRRFSVLHTRLNRLTGLALFLWPLTMGFIPPESALVPLCALAFIASAQETYLILWQ